MVVQVTRHNVKWLSPSPIWGELGDISTQLKRNRFARPSILRFNNDSFMDEYLAVMNYYPDRLIEWEVKPETWREPMSTPKTAAQLSLNEPVSKFNKQQKRQLENQTNIISSTENNQENNVTDKSAGSEKPLKLYQPPHQRFYLVTASLVCRNPGLPDRIFDNGKQEKVSFLLRRVVPKKKVTILEECTSEDCEEFAYVLTETGSQWRNITNNTLLDVNEVITDEERLPMFTVGYDDLTGRKRRLLSGFIPVSNREAYVGAQFLDEATLAAKDDVAAQLQQSQSIKKQALKTLFKMDVVEPWKNLVEQAKQTKDSFDEALSTDNRPSGDDVIKGNKNANKILTDAREQIQTLSWYILLDCSKFLEKYLPDVWQAILQPSLKSELNDQELDLVQAFENSVITPANYASQDLYASNGITHYYYTGATSGTQYQTTDFEESFRDALVAIKGGLPFNVDNANKIEDQLESADEPYDRQALNSKTIWPAFLFPLADPLKAGPAPYIPGSETDINTILSSIESLLDLVELALPSIDVAAPEVPATPQLPLDSREAWFVIRCVYEKPNCGPFNLPVVSNPTKPFQMASFFDPDSPSRDILIPMPIDISPAGLRKHQKNTTFLISDMLCGKIKKMKNITFGDMVLSVLPWPFHKDLPNIGPTGPCGKPNNNFGMFCSLSIPIVTLCALVLLIIMVTLFDIFFRWLPLLFTCFTLPGFRGKK